MNSLVKQLSRWVLSFFCLTNCQEHEAPASQSPAQRPVPAEPAAPVLAAGVDAARVRADFGGVWLNAAYVARLEQTRSPRRADGQWGASGVTLVSIDPRSYHGDSLQVEMGYGNHEGGPTHYLHLSPVYTGTVLPARADRSLHLAPIGFRYHVQGPDTVLYLHEGTQPGQRARISAFRKVRSLPVAEGNLDRPMEQFVNRQVLAGTHAAADTAGHRYVVRFSAEGQVTGLPGHQRYWVNFDFVGPFQEYDYVVFDHDQPTEEMLAFVPRGDTLRLYRVLDDTTAYKRRLGKLRFTMVRQK